MLLRQQQAGNGAKHKNQRDEPKHGATCGNSTWPGKQQACQNSIGKSGKPGNTLDAQAEAVGKNGLVHLHPHQK